MIHGIKMTEMVAVTDSQIRDTRELIRDLNAQVAEAHRELAMEKAKNLGGVDAGALYKGMIDFGRVVLQYLDAPHPNREERVRSHAESIVTYAQAQQRNLP